MLRKIQHLLALLGIGLLLTFSACKATAPTPTPFPTPEPQLTPSSPAPISAANAGEVRPLATWFRAPVYNLSWSPDQRIMAVASFGGAYIYDAHTLKELR